MLSPLLGIAGVNSLLFASYAISKRVVSPFPDKSLKEIALAGGMAGAVNAVLASPGKAESTARVNLYGNNKHFRIFFTVEMFKVRMQGQYGAAGDQRLRAVFAEVAKDGFRKGIMRGYWVRIFLPHHIQGD